MTSLSSFLNSTTAAHATAKLPVSHRRFVKLVRAKLDSEGHQDVEIRRQWIDESDSVFQFLLNVPVGAELIVPLRVVGPLYGASGTEAVTQHVADFAGALVTLRKAERMLTKYVRDVRRAAVTAIAAARGEGLDILLANVTLKPTYACLLTGHSWEEAAYSILAVVHVRHTSSKFEQEVSEFWVEEPEDVAEELEEMLTIERERQAQIAELDATGTELVVDGITLDLLTTHIADFRELLREV